MPGFNLQGIKLTFDRAKKKRRVSVKPPYSHNPFNRFHMGNANRRMVANVDAIYYYINSHIRHKNDDVNEPFDDRKIAQRTEAVLKMFTLSRNAQSTGVREDGEQEVCGQGNHLHPVPRILGGGSEGVRPAREAGQSFDMDLKDLSNVEHLDVEAFSKKPGTKCRGVFILITSMLFGRRSPEIDLAPRSGAAKRDSSTTKGDLAENSRGDPHDCEMEKPDLLVGLKQLFQGRYSDAVRKGHWRLITMFFWPETAKFWAADLQ
ncbi:hypothetical protein PRZ48_015039 [Zasmidium cellare]|uniref:Uncharacterized protein n=1 Tax=Zasmidium cellare TaxID=395010 RepID=A0ABR0DXH5_ZASCE|nr:hypothetical protein PRZ48_015039 [Zasmidium cellare]